MRFGPRLLLQLLVVLLAFSIFAGLGQYALQDPDEGRYSDIAANMVRDGSWVTPRLNGIAYYSKPPLYFWLAATSMSLFGFGEAAARLPSALASLLTILLVCHWGWRTRGPRVGLLAALVLASMPLFGLLERAAMVDPVLTLLVTAAAFAGHRAFESARPARRWILAFWVVCALTILTKGPLGVVLSAAPLGLVLVLQRNGAALRALLRPDGPVLMLLVASPWFVAMASQNEGYLHQFLYENNVQRFTNGGRFGRTQPWWFYVPILLGGLLPWSLLLPASLARAWRDRGRAAPDRLGASTLWLAGLLLPLAFFSISTGKLAYYLLPCCPPAALLIADFLIRSPGVSRWRAAWLGAPLVLLSVSLGLLVSALLSWGYLGPFLSDRFGADVAEQVRTLRRPVAVALASLAAGCGVGAWWALRAKPVVALSSYALGFVAFLGVLPWALGNLNSLSVPREVAREATRARRPGEPILSFGHYYRGVPYYLGHPVVLWEARHAEFGHASGARDQAFCLDADAGRMVERLHGSPSNLILVSDEEERRALDRIVSCPLQDVASVEELVLVRSSCEGSCAPRGTL